jgi:hypothetical protein
MGTKPQPTDSHPICPTCESDLTGKEYPEYFAQSEPTLGKDDLTGWSEDINKLLLFSRAVFDAFHQMGSALEGRLEDETHERLAWLGWELTKEIERRADGLYQAGQIWQDRAEHGTANRKEG